MMNIERKPFGKTARGEAVTLFEIRTPELTARILDYGATVQALLVLIGLCTSVMWGGIFNLAVEGLGKYTEKASGIFMALVCGGGILPLIQGGVADFAGYLSSYWVVVAGLAYMLFYALVGSKNVNKDIPVEE